MALPGGLSGRAPSCGPPYFGLYRGGYTHRLGARDRACPDVGAATTRPTPAPSLRRRRQGAAAPDTTTGLLLLATLRHPRPVTLLAGRHRPVRQPLCIHR